MYCMLGVVNIKEECLQLHQLVLEICKYCEVVYNSEI